MSAQGAALLIDQFALASASGLACGVFGFFLPRLFVDCGLTECDRIEIFSLGVGKLLPREHHVWLEHLAEVDLQLGRRHLQEANRLLQLRGHGQRLTQLELQGVLEHGGLYLRKIWPKSTSRTRRLARISSAEPAAITVPSPMMYERWQTPSVSRTL
jgi:hypothetical protein